MRDNNRNYKNRVYSTRTRETRHRISTHRRGSVGHIQSISAQRKYLGMLQLCAASIVIVLLLLFLLTGPVSRLFSGSSSMAAAKQRLSEEQYKIIEVKKGDSLWSIARDNISPGYSGIRSYIREIKKCNQLDSDNVVSGTYLMLPYYELEDSDYISQVN